MKGIEEKLKVIVQGGYPCVLYVNFKELGQQFLVCQTEDLKSKTHELFQVRDEYNLQLTRVQDFMRKVFSASIDMVIIKRGDKTAITRKLGHLNDYFILDLKDDLSRRVLKKRNPGNFIDRDLKQGIEELKDCLTSSGLDVSLTAEFIALQLAWLALRFPKLKLYAFSPVSLSETIDCLHFILIENGATQLTSIEQIREYFLSASGAILEGIAEVRWQLFSRNALRSAIAAIISRNMSHNIGSHVLARLSTKDAVQAAVLNKVSGSGLALEISKEAAAVDTAHLNAFLRMRMDFVADVATAATPPNPMKMCVLADVFPPFTNSALLWDTLCASHGLRRENVIFYFNVISNTKTQVKMKAGNDKIEAENDSGSIPEQIAMATIGVPNGTIGCQALYCIIENFIRNTVKHSVRSNQQNFEVTISLYEDGEWTDNDRLMKFIIHDNWAGCRSKSGLVDDLNEKLAERVIRDDGSLVASNRGLKEMKATAAYLRGLLPESVDDSDTNPPLLKALDVESNLGYEFFVLRPKDLLVFNTGMDIAKDKRDLLKKQGVDTLSETPTFQAKARDYPFLLITNADDGILQVLNDPAHSPDLPLRIIVQRENSVTAQCGSWQLTLPLSNFQTTFDELRASLQNGQGMAATARVWELWTRITCQDQPPELEIYEDKRLTQWNVESISKLVQENDDPDGSTNVVLYARHGHPKRGNPSVKFYEPYGKGVDPISFVLENPSQQEETRRGMIYQLMDAGLVPIVIIDERVQEAAYSVKRAFPEDPTRSNPEDMAFWLSLMGVYMPPKEIDLESKQLNQQQLQNWLTQKGQQLLDGKLPSLLIIHQGILDVIGLQDPVKAQQWIDSQKSLFCDVIITSGRGIPDNIPPRARFIPLSTVLLYTVERKSKFHLVQSLLAARRPKR